MLKDRLRTNQPVRIQAENKFELRDSRRGSGTGTTAQDHRSRRIMRPASPQGPPHTSEVPGPTQVWVETYTSQPM